MKKGKILKKSKLKNKSIILILGTIYTLISILAVISYVSAMNTISTTPVTLSSIFSAVWWQLLMIILFGVVFILYSKKQILGILLEIIMGISMLVYMLISIWMMGINILALLVELIYPVILTVHGTLELKKLSKTKKSAV